MRRRKSFSHLLNRLSFEEKLVGAASLVTIIACFLPWYGISSRIMNQWWNGFSSVGYIVGYVVFFIALAVLYGVLAPLFSLPTPKILSRKISYLVLHGESAFLLIILSFIYARYTIFDAPGSSVRFGLYTALIASFVGAISGYVLWKKHVAELRKKGLQEDFIQMPRVRNEYAEMEMTPEINDEPVINEQETLMPEDDDDINRVMEVHAEEEEEEEIVEPVEEVEEVEEVDPSTLQSNSGSSRAGRETTSSEPDRETEPEITEEEVEDVNRDSTIEELSSSFQSRHQGLKTNKPEVDEVDDSTEPTTSEEKEEDKVGFDF